MSRINTLILCLVVTLTLLNLTFAVPSPVLDDKFELECNFTSESAQWRKNCNWCRCSETGRGLCTRRGCPPGLETRLGEEKDCTENANWKEDCNWCTCIEERKVCTSKFCGNLPVSVPKIERVPIGRSLDSSPSSPSCESVSDGASFKDDCNWCRCANNTAQCTKKLCPPAEEVIKSATATVTSDCNGEVVWRRGCERCECVDGFSVCTPDSCDVSGPKTECTKGSEGGRWRKDCNWCTCGNGLGLCTRRGCMPGDLLRDTPVCEGEITWKEECNWCRCIEGKALCTKDICGLNSKDESKCQDGQAWVDGCNNCFCNNGMPFCTRRACARAPMNEIQPAVLEKRAIEVSAMSSGPNEDFGECTDGSRWMRNCNWCSCSNKTAVCTLRGCLPGYEEKQKPPFCDENSRWKEDCNMCSCANGVPVCTKKGCGPFINVPQTDALSFTPLMTIRRAEGVTCTENSRWKIDCNWCTCSNGIGACTAMGCIPGFKDQGPVCEGESRWKARDGSWCKCESGQAVCQMEPAVFNVNPRTGTLGQSNSENSECKDGSKWKKNCNWCSCRGGRGICTLRGCLPGSKNEGPECEEGSEWRGDGCSWCHCEGGRSVCVPSTCSPQAQPGISPMVSSVPQVQKREASCTDGSRWTQLCNWCTCSNGVGLCEQRACLSDAAKEMDKTCERDSRWKIDCNWCNCVDGRGICTSNDCTHSVSNDPVSTNDGGCVSGNSWLEQCNICVCTNNTAICTKKACLPQQRNSVQCTDGDFWRDDCNSCQCINGEAACTKKLCPSQRNSQEIASLCFLPAVNPDVKLCGGFETRWTFNSIKGKCEDVIYGGCGATENLFANEQECQITCGTQEPDMKLANLTKDPKVKCSMPVVPGPCFARHERYAFFSERNRCEKFYYGGCQGNENNFESVNDCYNTCGGNPPVLDPECDRSKCDWKRYQHYLAQDCEPIYEGEPCCPTRFACKSEEERGLVSNKCYYKGKEYQLNDAVPVDDECSASCKCLLRNDDNLAEITCANVECPSLFRKPNPGCRLLFTPGQCCETDRECVDPNVMMPPQVDQRSSNCHWKNESFQLGDKMFFNDDPCKTCICTADFTDPTGPGCKQLSCKFDFKFRSNYIQGCVPLYFEDRCCSIDWICPGDRRLENAVVQPNSNFQEVDTTNVCMLGDLTVPIGESIKLSDCQIKCDCKTPPGLTCVKYRSCDIAQEVKQQSRLQIRTTAIGSEASTQTFTCSKPDCPPSCLNPSTVFDQLTGCNVCKCECRKDFTGKPPCPMDCAIKIFFDAETGCDKCICDSSVTVNPFHRPKLII